MPPENVEVVRRSIDAFNRRDLRELAELCHEDLEFVSVLTAVEETSYRGKDAFARYLAVMDQTWEEWRTEDHRIFDGGDDRVAGVLRLIGKGRHSGVPVEREVGLAYTIRQGKIWRLRSYLNPVEALEAVGCGTDK
jgi:ketosteroid isomerase-like protein